MNEKYQSIAIAKNDSVCDRCASVDLQFSIEKQYPNHVYQIETFFSEENCLIFVEFKRKDAWEAAVFPATAQVNTGNQPLATVATEKPRVGEIVAIFAIGLWRHKLKVQDGAWD